MFNSSEREGDLGATSTPDSNDHSVESSLCGAHGLAGTLLGTFMFVAAFFSGRVPVWFSWQDNAGLTATWKDPVSPSSPSWVSCLVCIFLGVCPFHLF